ncbi:16S rRNA (cytidine(1402)-2'-O)-methyltransferase [Candidatus Parcubacteria bacterium]|jgi:16S rRNA (cytidine1402-2'-O)-methyltransferase|nr:16S rRNA (cytidine(1402)-2'-O)-methyltransferase [Candidatus Parcubacteria bacterium]
MNTGKLYIVATPIGNLGDFTFRAVETLKNVDLILCEDTRVTHVLLKHYDISTQTMSYHQHSDDEKVEKIKELLDSGNDIALVTDAGTPGISDPGNKLIHDLMTNIEDLEAIPIPGASAVITALSISGFPTDKFIFMGFPPHKKGRQTYFKKLAEKEYTVAIYESPHRIEKTLANLSEVLDHDKKICICRELTKKFETIYRGSVGGIGDMRVKYKGEFVVVVSS